MVALILGGTRRPHPHSTSLSANSPTCRTARPPCAGLYFITPLASGITGLAALNPALSALVATNPGIAAMMTSSIEEDEVPFEAGYVKLRGFPRTVTKQDIIAFFKVMGR